MRFVGGNDGRVFALNPGVRELGVFDWGVKPPPPRMVALAKILLIELLKDQQRATALYMRFMHRVLTDLPAMQPWTRTDVELMAVVKQIEEAEREMIKQRQQMERERPMVVPAGPQFPGATGFGSNDSAPDRRKR